MIPPDGSIRLADAGLPAYLVCSPLSLSTVNANNVFMDEMSDEERRVDLPTAFRQFRELVSVLAREGLVYTLPSPEPLQDQVYVSNVGVVPPHVPNVALMANFASAPRRGEELVAAPYLAGLGFEVEFAPELFEGEADLKYLGGSAYACAYGMRTSKAFHGWFAERFDATVVSVEMTEPRCYHLDCLLLPLPKERIAVSAELVGEATCAELSRFGDLVDVPLEHARAGALNCVVLTDTLLFDSNLEELDRTDPAWDEEAARVHVVEQVAEAAGLTAEPINIAEYWKSGAGLSCLVMQLNRSARPA